MVQKHLDFDCSIRNSTHGLCNFVAFQNCADVRKQKRRN